MPPPLQVDLDLESGVRVMCDVGYLCANFSLPRPLCSRLRLDVRDRQTDVRQHHRLMPPPSKVKVIRPLCSPPCWRVRRLQLWAWERVDRGKLLLRCRLLGFGTHRGGEGRGHIVAAARLQLGSTEFHL